MKFNRNTPRNKAVTTIAGLVLCWSVLAPEICTALDAYVIYSGKNYQEKESFLATLPKEFSVKSYNADLLAVADYSGKQKALTKFQRASVIVILLDEPMQLLRGATVKSNLVIVQSVMTSVKSEARTLYVLSQGTDFAQLGGKLKTLTAINQENFPNKKELQGADLVLVEEKTLHVMAAASLATATILKPQ